MDPWLTLSHFGICRGRLCGDPRRNSSTGTALWSWFSPHPYTGSGDCMWVARLAEPSAFIRGG